MKQNKITKISLGFCLLFAFIFGMINVSADTMDTENWTRYQNSSSNNGVTDRPGPTDANHMTGLWSVSMGQTATTPPLIVGDKIYTASGYYVYCFDKATGKKLGQSDQLKGYVGFALHPMVYAEGKLFVSTSKNGAMIEAFNLDDPVHPKWIWSSSPKAGTSYSPLSYHYNESTGKGYLYTGTYNDDKPGYYFCIAASDGSTVWSMEDANGFYWAGAYATDHYVAFASENEIGGNDESEGSVLYTVGPDGKVIDSITNLKGSIRNTVVYDNGYLYVGTVAGRLYRIKVDENGNLGKNNDDFSYTDLDGRIKATVLIHNNRLYAAVEGKTPDTSYYNVIDCSGALNSYSVKGAVSVEDEPKGAPVLSTAENGISYIYFTCNKTSGGIYYFTDDGQNISQSQCLYEPESAQQQQCISSLALDQEGNIYYTNDSKYLIAVGPKLIQDVEITPTSGSGVKWDDQRFDAGVKSYHLTVGDSVTGLQFGVKKLDSEDASISCNLIVDGVDQGSNMTVSLNGETTNVELQVTRKAITITYNFTIYKVASDNTSLGVLYYGEDLYSGNNLLPAIEEGRTEYSVDLRKTSVSNPYLWVLPLHSGAEVEIYAVENVKKADSNTQLQNGKALDWIDIERTGGEYKYEVLPFDTGKNTVVRVCVKSADGTKTQNYQVSFIRTDASATTQAPATTTQAPATTTQAPQATTTAKPAATTAKPTTTTTAKTVTKTYGQKAFSIKKSGTTTYSSSNKNIITVSKAGTASIKGVGKVVLTVKNTKNGKTTITKTPYIVKPGTIASKSLKVVNLSTRRLKISWTKRAGLGLTYGKVRYQIQYSTSKKFTKSTTKTLTVKGNTTSKIVSKLKKKKTYYVRMRGYDQTNKKAGSWSAVKKVTIKK